MRLTSKEARTLLEIERKNTTDDRWIEHCISVGDICCVFSFCF